jgi:hypothetical protein
MGGNWETYRCGRCPLIIELGGYAAWDETGVVFAETVQVACAACGTMHRISEERGVRRVTALPGPVRAMRMVTAQDISGEEIETEVWSEEDDWLTVGQHPGGVDALDWLTCSHCGRAGQMLTHENFLYPGGYVAGAARREECPLCLGPMECIAVTDAI